MKKRLQIFCKGKVFFVYFDNNLIFVQHQLAGNSSYGGILRTHMYLNKILARFGLISNLKK